MLILLFTELCAIQEYGFKKKKKTIQQTKLWYNPLLQDEFLCDGELFWGLSFEYYLAQSSLL